MSEFLIDILKPDRLTAIVDVGANPIDGDAPYRSLLERRLCRVTGFEPQHEALSQLNARKSDLESYLPYVVGDGSQGRLHICRASGMTGLLAPDPNALRHFNGFSELGAVIGEESIETRRLDDIAEIESLDFLKIDVQGSELAVFQSGRSKLSAATIIQTEVSFINFYKDQPSFGELDMELRSQGFIPHALLAQKRRLIAPMVNDDRHAGLNQILEADAVYVRNYMVPETLTSGQLKHMAIVAHYCYGSFDLASNCIHHLAARGDIDSESVARYAERCMTYKVDVPKEC